jgi:crotonobetainyl-CoA:carnitine CoA-transferase CaiB-like acyl-CoA transferase
VRGAHAFLAAPYGVHRASDGWIALPMTPLTKLGPLLGLGAHPGWDADADAFAARDALGEVIATRIAEKTVAEWLAILEPADVWCAEVRDWPALMETATFRGLGMVQEVGREDGARLRTLRVPLRFEGARPTGKVRAAPLVGEHTARLREEFGL